MGPTNLLPLRSRSCYGVLSLLETQRPRPGLNPRTLHLLTNTLTTRPPRATYITLTTYSTSFDSLFISEYFFQTKFLKYFQLEGNKTTTTTNCFLKCVSCRLISVWILKFQPDRRTQIEKFFEIISLEKDIWIIKESYCSQNTFTVA
jgi:hypothetical protein